MVDKVLDSLLRIHVELFPPDAHLFTLRVVLTVFPRIQRLHLRSDLRHFIFERLEAAGAGAAAVDVVH